VSRGRDREICPGKCPHIVVGSAIKTIHRLIAKGKENTARLQLLMTFPELTDRQIDLIVAGRNCVGEDVSDRVGIVCRF
jgi:hypothetical protein